MTDTKPKGSAPEEEAHSILGASGAYRWIPCPGSVAMSADMPDSPSEYAKEGTAAHELAAYCLNRDVKHAADFMGLPIPNTDAYLATEDMCEAVQVYLDTIREDMANGENMFRVYDYKHGAGQVVEVERNPQLMYYSLGATYDLTPTKTKLKEGEHKLFVEHKFDLGWVMEGMFGTADGVLAAVGSSEVEIVVVQPRAIHPDGPIRRWRTTTSELNQWQREVLLPAAQATQEPNAKLKAGGHCKFCRASAVCPTLSHTALEIAQADFDDADKAIVPEIVKLTESAMRRILDNKSLFISFLNDVEAHVQNALMKGETFEGYKLVAKRSNRAWVSESEAVAAANDFFKTKEMDPKKYPLYEPAVLKSPSKMENMGLGKMKKHFVAKMVDHYYKPEAGVTLAKESDAKPAVPPPKSARVEFLKADLENEDWFQ